ncbi:hypothetical protein G5I_11850 [Acromyrmex echinatior]|uniref:Uncharacterized protein n=1 Tax=Acromyrmex echinatior TaxID=103372 RepID=F4X0R7_ACREC|nr:hypothetical protein G5I_11850 [Acromyrmex echinatior]
MRPPRTAPKRAGRGLLSIPRVTLKPTPRRRCGRHLGEKKANIAVIPMACRTGDHRPSLGGPGGGHCPPASHHSPRTDDMVDLLYGGTAMKCAMCWETTYGHVSRI